MLEQERKRTIKVTLSHTGQKVVIPVRQVRHCMDLPASFHMKSDSHKTTKALIVLEHYTPWQIRETLEEVEQMMEGVE